MVSLLNPKAGGKGDQKREKLLVRDIMPPVSEWGPGAHRMWHVDGDVVIRWMEKGERLSELVRRGTEDEVVERSREHGARL